MGLGFIEGTDRSDWLAKLVTDGTYAHCFHKSDPRLQRVFRTLYQVCSYFYIAHMITANNMSISNIYTRRVLAGEFQVVCPWLLRDLVDLGLWDDYMKNMIIAHNGSIQNIPNIPDDVKAIYKTVWEISQKKVLDLAADRGAFICQSQSLNVHLQAPTTGQLTSMHFYGWKKGLKTGMYYLRTRPAAQAIQFTVDQSMLKEPVRVAKTPRPSPPRMTSSISRTPTVSSSTSAPSVTPSTSFSKRTSPATSPILPPTPPSEEDAVLVEKPLESPVVPAAQAVVEEVKSDIDPEFAAALKRQEERRLAEEKLMCSLENKEACLMCSG